MQPFFAPYYFKPLRFYQPFFPPIFVQMFVKMSSTWHVFIFGLVLALSLLSDAKVFNKCELARKLRSMGFAGHEVPIWVCIAENESHYDTAAIGNKNADKSKDHGIIQINDRYWCTDRGAAGKACGKRCSEFRNDDVTDDFECARKIFKETKKLRGDGFAAWTVYNQKCKGKTGFTNGC